MKLLIPIGMLPSPFVRFCPLLVFSDGENGERILLANGALVRQIFLGKRTSVQTAESAREPRQRPPIVAATYRLEDDTC